MRCNFKLFIAGLLLFAGGNLALAEDWTVEKFNSIWSGAIQAACYSGGDVVECSCIEGNAVRGCVRSPRQRTGSFDNEGDVEIRKLVWPTSIPGIYDVSIMLRGKRVTQTRNDLKVCSVVVFDKSGSMKNGYNSGSDTKRDDAVSGAVEFSNVLISGNEYSEVGLVFFAAKASNKRLLEHAVFDQSLFDFTPSGETNIHDGLVKAGNMLSGSDCIAKYIVLMSDGDANRFGPSGSSATGGITGPSMAKEVASELKSQGIVIYSIGYDLGSSNARNTLRAIAQDAEHYFEASGADISDIFQDIGNVTVELNAGTPSNIDDEIGGAMLRMGDEIQIVDGAQIIDPGTVYSFQIKIKTGVVGFQPSNNGLTLMYKDITGDDQTLAISPENSAQIYWTAPKCEGIYPSGILIKTGADTFIQDWVGNVLKPETKEWSYTTNSNPGECEWTCNNVGYGGNTKTNTCEIKVKVTFDPNGGIGNIPSQTVASGMDAEEPTVQPTRAGYQFSGWALSGEKFIFPGPVTGNITLKAIREPITYTIIFDGNGASAGTMSGLDMIYDQENALTMNAYSRNGYKFLGWNTLSDGKGTNYTDGQMVKNLATEGEVRLYAQWEKLGSSGSGGPSGGGGGCKKDDCPDGDYSGDRCDGKCGTPPSIGKKDEPEPTPAPEPSSVIPNKKCSIDGSTYSAEVNEAYVWACERGIIKSNTIQGARLGEFLNRAEMAKITTLFEMGELYAKPNRNKDCLSFADSISGYNQEMKDYMVTSCQLLRMGIHTADYTPIKDFMPKKFVSRAEFGTILSRILWGKKYEAPKNTRYYYVDHLNRLKDTGILTNINPTLVERRSYAILMIYRAAKMMGKI